MNRTAFAAALCVLSALMACASAEAAPVETAAKQVLLIDDADGTVLLSRNPHEKVEPASLTKLMTAEILLSELKAGKVQDDTIFTVSVHAWRTGGAPSGSVAMFLKPKEEVRVIDLLRGIVVQSGNDAAITIAENLEGSEEAFAERMNRRAAELGLSEFELPQSLRSERSGAEGLDGRSDQAGPPHPQHLSGLLADLRRAGIRVEQDLPAQPEPRRFRRDRRRRAQDGSERIARLRRRRDEGAG